MTTPRRGRAPNRPGGTAAAAAQPLAEHEIAELQSLLDDVPAPLEPLDVSALDGFLCGVLVQPQTVAPARWLRFVTDVEGRPLPAGFDARPLACARAPARGRAAARDRAARLVRPVDLRARARKRRATRAPPRARASCPGSAVAPPRWKRFPALLGSDDDALTAPLALLYRHVDTDTLDDAEALRDEIEMLEPPADLAAAVEELVRATLLLADIAGVRSTR